MARIRGENHAFGWPGLESRWTHGDKDGIGTAYSAASRIWFTVWNGIVTEVYYPTVDTPQMRDVQLLFTDGESFFHQETKYLESRIQRMPSCLGYRVEGTDPEGRYAYVKEIIADPHLPCLLQRVTVQSNPEWLSRLKAYVLCAPHLDVGGSENNAFVVQSCGRELLMAEKNGTWLALMCSSPFSRLSVGYVGASDGWTDLSQGFQFDWQFDQALNGNVALTGELQLATVQEFVVAIAFGNSQQRAIATLFQSLAQPFDSQRSRFAEQWERACESHSALEDQSCDGGDLFRASYALLLAPRRQGVSRRDGGIAGHSLGTSQRGRGGRRRLSSRVGRGISFNAPAVCWRPAMWKHPSDRSSIWPPLKAMTAVSLRTFGSMEHPSGRAFNWTKWPFQFFWRINYGGQTVLGTLIHILWF